MKKSDKKSIKDRHRLLLKRISDGIRSGETEGKIMKDLGYSEAYSKNPNHLKETDSWQKLIEEQIPDKLLTKVHKGLLKNKDWRARDSGLEKGYKLKGKYAPEKIEIEEKVKVDEKELTEYKKWRKNKK